MIPQGFIQDLLARVDIVDVVGRSVKLKKSGSNWQGLCPFHTEKSPSFTVSAVKQFYHCFGCGAHGNVIGFLMEIGGLSYVEAIGELAGQMGLTVPQEPRRGAVTTSGYRGPPDRPSDRASPPQRTPAARSTPSAGSSPVAGPDSRTEGATGVQGPAAASVASRRLDRAAEGALLALLQRASDHYRQKLRETPRAIEYLKSRELSGRTAARFALGYSPTGWRGLEALARPPGDGTRRDDYGDHLLVEAGLVIAGEDGKRYDRFRDRIMFPIRDPRGRVIGFGGRIIDHGEPKYLNSPETPVFVKGRELYGLFEARQALREKNEVLVVEGYMDVVMLHQHGLGQVVATLGTATTDEQIVKLLRLVDRIVFAFDGDAAGRRAASRALQTVLPRLSDTRRFDFLFLPAEHDPDSFIRAHGLAAFERAMAEAMPLSAYLLREIGTALATPEDRAHALAQFRPMVAAMPDTALRLQLIHAVADRVQLELPELLGYLGLRSPPPATIPASAWDAGGARSRSGPAGRDGRGARDRRFASPPTMAPGGARGGVRLLPLAARIRGLLAMHPALARLAIDTAFLPEPVSQWRDRVARLSEGANFAALIEALRDEDPEQAAKLVRAAEQGSLRLTGELTFDQARAEYHDAVARLQRQQIEAQIRALVDSGLETEGGRARYEQLRHRLAEIDAPADERGTGESGVLDI
ncbi:MAG: DNA primase [Burkholderiaceae bacterium]